MQEMITLCGDNCLYCPRYNAKNDEKLAKVAELWNKIGWSNGILSNDEIKCAGCSSHKSCTYKLVECIKKRNVKKCNECTQYPCYKIKDMLERTEKYKAICKELCSKQEYDLLSKAFFEKETNLLK
jgi:hypothetical protein